jgi:phosphate/sulfate permease
VVAAGAAGLVGAAVGAGAAQANRKLRTTNTVIAKLTVIRIISPFIAIMFSKSGSEAMSTTR